MTNTVSNHDAGCEGDRLNSLQTRTTVKTERLTSRLQFDQDSFYLFCQSVSFAEIIHFNAASIRKGFSGARCLSQTSEWQRPNPEQPAVQ